MQRIGLPLSIHRTLKQKGHPPKRAPECYGEECHGSTILDETPMKLVAIAYLALMVATPAVAASPEIENYCWAQAAQIWFNGRGDREHFHR